jgi:hypothetical protein
VKRYSKKGYRSLRARDTDTGQVKTIAVKIGSSLDMRARKQIGQLSKMQKQEFREFKKQLRQAKKAIPLEVRGKVNWSEVENA